MNSEHCIHRIEHTDAAEHQHRPDSTTDLAPSTSAEQVIFRAAGQQNQKIEWSDDYNPFVDVIVRSRLLHRRAKAVLGKQEYRRQRRQGLLDELDFPYPTGSEPSPFKTAVAAAAAAYQARRQRG